MNTRRLFKAAREYGLARMIVINHIGADGVDLADVLAGIRETFGAECHPVNLPTNGGKGVIDVLKKAEGDADILNVEQCHTELLDSVVETDDALMEAYMETGKVAAEKLMPAVAHAVAIGHVIPVFFTDAKNEVGIEALLDEICTCAPSPAVGKQRTLITGKGEEATKTPIDANPDGDFLAVVFKITADPKSNIRYSCARVLSGKLTSNDQLFVGDAKGQRPGHILKLRGADHEELESANAGDIVALAKIEMHIGDVLRTKAGEGRVAMPKFAKPMFALALEPKARGDADKITTALRRFRDEDPCFEYHRDEETHELVMQGLGDEHLNLARSKMQRYYKLEVDTKPPKIPYHETIAGKATNVEYTHKKTERRFGTVRARLHRPRAHAAR